MPKPAPSKPISLWSAAGLILLAGALAAAGTATEGRFADLPEAIRQPLLRADEHLRRQEWDQARGVLRSLLAGAGEDHFWAGSYKALLWRLALAETGLGLTDDARWHWQAMQAFGSAPTAADLAPYGAVAEQLVGIPLRQPGAAPAGLPIDQGPGLAPPRRIQAAALDLQGLQGGAPPLWLQLELVVDAEGRVREPAVVDSSSRALSHRVLEEVRAWRYEPARRDGKPVAALVTVGVNSLREQPLAEILTPTGPLAVIDGLLLKGKWKQADTQAGYLWIQALHNAEQTRGAFALLLTQRALASAGRGENDLAVCRWQAAQGLAPQLFHADLSAYGAAGALLETHRWGFPIRQPREEPEPRPGPGEEVTRPVLRSRPKPEVPNVARKPGTRGTLRVESFVEKNGAIGQPFVRAEDLGTEPNFAASALDAVCRWRFAPATLKGEPVRASYSLTINFEVRP